ncbi:GTP-binding protein LepA [Maribacter chungangensis]|uniref:GTP-binding protein LepA n=1 Tax=Maribacter chungangensis TaxID=1069117 RepID=A0ABW3B9R8_9FLAO
MTTYIAQFTAKHRIIQVAQNTIFTWQQESGDIDTDLLGPKIIRESSIHFFRMVAGANYEISTDDISITVLKTEVFNG